MARTNALSILNGVDQQSQAVRDKLAEIYGEVIEAIQKGAISEQIKNKNYSGTPEAGSIEISRFKNATVNNYKTARTAGNGDAVDNSGKVTINVDTDKEIVEEIENKDIALHGVDGIAEKRKVNHEKRMIAYLDNQFFACAEAEGSAVTPSGSTVAEKLEELIQSVETTTNDWVDGVDRDMLVVTVTPAVYGQLLNYIDSVPNSLTGLKDNMFHNVRIYSNHRQTKSMICMLDGAIGQPVVVDEYEAEKLPLSNAVALELFFSKGTKAVTPDLIKFIA